MSRVDRFDPSTGRWGHPGSAVAVAHLQTARSAVAVAALDGAVYVVGGEADSLIYDTVERLEPPPSSGKRTELARWRLV